MSFTRALIVIACFIPSFALADLDAPKTVRETLILMVDALRDYEQVRNIDINWVEQSFEVEWQSSEILKAYPNNLHMILTEASTPKERQDLFDFHIETLVETGLGIIPDTSSDNLTNIYPVLRHESFAHTLRTQEPQSYVTGARIGDSLVFFAIDGENSVAFLTASKLEELGITISELMEKSEDNLVRRLDDLRIEGEGVYYLTLDGFYESSFVSYAPLWQDIDEQIGQVLMGFPTRDLVVFVDGDLPGSREILIDIVTEFSNEGAYPVSDLIYIWNKSHWMVSGN